MKYLLLIALMLVLAAMLYVGGMMLLAVVTQYHPAAVKDVALVKSKSPRTEAQVINDSVFTFVIWNLGYGGLGKEVDYFYDGGKMVTSPKQHVLKNNKGMVTFLVQHKDADFIMLQEVDRKGKRSWNIDQAEQFANALPGHNYAFTPNYIVQYLPFPFLDPIGKVYGGLQTLSKFTPQEIKRIALSNITDFPRRLFYLKRCLLLERYKLANGKDLVIINTHFEAYDAGGLVKKEQRAETKKILDEEYAKGNYVVLGGDWNIAPPGFDVHTWDYPKITDELYLRNNDSIYIPGWNYVFDRTTSSNRKNDGSYVEGKSYKTIIDYFYLSPNLEAEEIHGIDLGFNYSDHNPVVLRIKAEGMRVKVCDLHRLNGYWVIGTTY